MASIHHWLLALLRFFFPIFSIFAMFKKNTLSIYYCSTVRSLSAKYFHNYNWIFDFMWSFFLFLFLFFLLLFRWGSSLYDRNTTFAEECIIVNRHISIAHGTCPFNTLSVEHLLHVAIVRGEFAVIASCQIFSHYMPNIRE